MTIVRKKAMDSFLKDNKNDPRPRRSDRQRLNSHDSSGTHTSVGSDEATANAVQSQEVPESHKGQGTTRRQRQVSANTPAPGNRNRKSSNPERQLVHPRKSVDNLPPLGPIVVPMRNNIKLPYDVQIPPPFVSLGKAVDPFQTMFQSSFPQVSVETLKFHCARFFGTRAMGQHWIPTVLSSAPTFLSTLCIASSHYDAIHERGTESVETMALRIEVVHLIGQSILNPTEKVGDQNIATLIQLIVSEMIGRDEFSLAFHERGIEAMVRVRGGLNQLGINGHLANTISWSLLESAILQEKEPRPMFVEYCAAHSSKVYPTTTTIPESPIYCPRGRFMTVQSSPRCNANTLKLLNDIRTMTDLFLLDSKRSSKDTKSIVNLHSKITTEYPSISELRKTVILTHEDWRYEAIRITAIIQATAMLERVPLSRAVVHVSKQRKPSSIYASSIASHSSESLVSYMDPRHDSFTSSTVSPPYAWSPSTTQPTDPGSCSARPSFSSSSSSSLDHLQFPRATTLAADDPHSLLTSLKLVIQNSDLSNCWSEMAGVLMWIGLTIGAASRTSEDKALKKWFSALPIRASVLLCFEHPQAVNSTLLKMSEIIQALSEPTRHGVVGPRIDVSGKKRKM
jgi:hypothetical protein